MDNENSSSKIHTVQPLRDLESNWGVDLVKSLEDYLLKICSGEISSGDDSHFSVNFAEAALLLQGSVQVYSRKVEYLYNLVLHALEFISESRSQDHVESTSAQPEASSSHAVHDEDDQFWVSDDVPVDGKNCLDNAASKDTSFDHVVKAPANLVVIEGDCLDSTDGGGELESYLLATNNLYRDFILLDPCDAVSVDLFLKDEKAGDRHHGGCRGTSLISKAHKSFLSPPRSNGGTARKSSMKKGLDASPGGGANKTQNDDEAGPFHNDIPDNGNYGYGSDDENQHEDFDDSDGDDPWKPLNPHEPGNLKVKPFKKVVKVHRKIGLTSRISVASQFPLAKLHGTISPELTGIWEMHFGAREGKEESKPVPLYEKLRQTLAGGDAKQDGFCPPVNGDAEDVSDDEINDFEKTGFDMPDVNYMDEQENVEPNLHDAFADHYGADNADLKEDPSSQLSLEDLCRAHLDSLLASIAENEKQTELAARVSSWKQRIEDDLEEEDSRPPFDIHAYGDCVLDKLSLADDENVLSFGDVVKGQEKHDVARTFSALLQLVNDRKVDLDRSGSTSDSFCYTATNPFHVWLLTNAKGPKKMQFQLSKKRRKSPIKKSDKGHLKKAPSVGSPSSSGSKSRATLLQPNCKFSTKLEKNGLRCTPDGKRRRRSRLVDSVDLDSAR
ncbi:condensin-2 complex subunit H2 isoform X1 [Amaranthus tricolor]|uniref:condensin-2 complex subunit H2 isoform X1 n=1 Tax=Amaranthus tricolor TaxID=29722 RepID=UPI00258AF443|nr:condensin-2 complex subunit H2 isoform X1 [Amaranthus tricolor]